MKSLNTRIHETWNSPEFRAAVNGTPMARATLPKSPRLLGESFKTRKGEKKGVLTAILYLSPAKESGVEMCPFRTPGCTAACLGHSSGQMTFSTSKNSRLWKTALFLHAPDLFETLLCNEIRSHEKRAARKGLEPAVRLNGTSDVVPSERYARVFPGVQFYDYTKSFTRARLFAAGAFPENYHVTFSRAETLGNQNDAVNLARIGANVAVAFDVDKGAPLPETFMGLPVIDADETDIRYADGRGVVAGLRFKGHQRAGAVRSGFAVKV